MSRMSEMERLKTIIERLRAKDGCPWDSTQTHLEDVAKTAADKMVRRHPHLFGGAKYSSEAEKDAAWEEIKRAEKEGREWQEPYLAAAMEEAKELIDVAERRKGFRKE